MSEKTAILESTPAPLGKPGGPGLFRMKGARLPNYIEQIAKGLMEKRGMTRSRAIQTSIGVCQRWARGGGDVHPEVRAAAAKAIAEWEARKAEARAKPNKSDHSNDTAAVELAAWSEALHPRAPQGSASGGQFVPLGKARDSKAAAAQTDKTAQANYQKIQQGNLAPKDLSDEDLQNLTKILYSYDTANEQVVAARIAVANEMTKRGFPIRDYGALGGGLTPGTGKDAKPAKAAGKAVKMSNTAAAVELARSRVPSGNTGGGQFYGDQDYPSSARTREVPKVTAANRSSKSVPPAKRGSVEDRLHRKLVARGVKPSTARKLAKRAAARVRRQRSTKPAASVAAMSSGPAGNVIELADIHQWKHGWVPLTPYAAAIKAKMAHGSTHGHSPDLPKSLHSKAAELHSKHGKSVVHGSYGHSEVPAGHASRKARDPKRMSDAELHSAMSKHTEQARKTGVAYTGPEHRAINLEIGHRDRQNMVRRLDSKNLQAHARSKTSPLSGYAKDEMARRKAERSAKAAEAKSSGKPSVPAAAAESKVTAKVESKKATPESKRAAERKTLSKDERKVYNEASAAANGRYESAQRRHQAGMYAAAEHRQAKQRAADIAHYTPEQRAIYDRETSGRYGSSHHDAMRMVDVLMKERAAAQEKKAAEDAKNAKDLADFKANLGSMSEQQLHDAIKNRAIMIRPENKQKAALAGAELQRRASARTAERLAAKPEQVIGGAGLHQAGSAPHRHLVKQDGKVLGIVEGRTRHPDSTADVPTPKGETPTHYAAVTVGRLKTGTGRTGEGGTKVPTRTTEHASLADAVAAVQTRGSKVPRESKADQASLFDVPKTGRSTKAPTMAEGQLGGPIKFEGGRTGTVWADAPGGGKWVIPDERKPGEAHAIYVARDGTVHEELSSAATQKDWMQKFRGSTRTLNALDRAALAAPKARGSAPTPSAEVKVGGGSPEAERAALSDAQRRVYDITRNQVLARGPSMPNEQSVHERAMKAAMNDRLVADYERGRAEMARQQSERERAAFRRAHSTTAMRKAAEARQAAESRQSAASAATGGNKLSKVPDGDLLSSLQTLRSGPDFAGRAQLIAAVEAEMRRRGLKVPSAASMSSSGGNVVELARGNTMVNQPGAGSVEDRLYRKLCAKGVKPVVARKMAKRGAAKVKARSVSMSRTGGTVVELAKVPPRLRAAARQKAADNQTALPDGSWPIRNLGELSDALQSWGRAVASGRAATVKAWMLKRARALGASQDVIARIRALEVAA